MHITPAKTRKIRELLDVRRRELLTRYHETLDRADEEIADRSPEPVDVATEQWDVRVLDRMSNVDAQTLTKVVAAMRRLDGGTYGVCRDCKRVIAAARLEALPEAESCTDCAAEVERR